MSGAGKSAPRQQQPKGDIAPAHFVASVLQLGISPESVNLQAHAGAQSHPEDDASSERSGHRPTHIKCTDGALDAIRRCHSEFLSLLASELAAVTPDDDNGDGNGDKKKGDPSATGEHSSGNKSEPKGGRKRPRNDEAIPSSASATADVTSDGDSSTVLSRILNETDVMACMERLGMSQVANAASENINQWRDRNRAEMKGAADSEAASKSKQAKKLKKGFRDKDVTAEMIAEQERLLAESARAMKDRMAQQKP